MLVISVKVDDITDLYQLETKLWLWVDIQPIAGTSCWFFQCFLFFQSDAETEVWTMVNESNKTIKPSLQHMHYTYGIALYAVDFDFCRKWSSKILNKVSPISCLCFYFHRFMPKSLPYQRVNERCVFGCFRLRSILHLGCLKIYLNSVRFIWK